MNIISEIYKHPELSSRKLAAKLGVSKSTINKYRGLVGKGKYLFIDVENFPDVAVTFKRYDANISQDNVLENSGTLVSASWSWAGEQAVHSEVLPSAQALKRDDTQLCKTIAELIEQADVVIAHNGKRFDIPLINTRMLANKLPALKKVRVIDTLQMARQLKFPSNKLDSIAAYLGIGRKVQHAGITLWIRCMQGDKKALQEMRKYNIQDVFLLKNVFMRLLPYTNTGVNAGLFSSEAVCPSCGSEDIAETGNLVYTPAAAYPEIVCNHCGARSRSKKKTQHKLKVAS